MAWQMLRCRDTGRLWLWEQSELDAGTGRRCLIPDENTRLALYSQYEVMSVPSEEILATIPVGPPRGSWPYPADRDPMVAEAFEHPQRPATWF